MRTNASATTGNTAILTENEPLLPKQDWTSVHLMMIMNDRDTAYEPGNESSVIFYMLGVFKHE